MWKSRNDILKPGAKFCGLCGKSIWNTKKLWFCWTKCKDLEAGMKFDFGNFSREFLKEVPKNLEAFVEGKFYLHASELIMEANRALADVGEVAALDSIKTKIKLKTDVTL